MLRNKHHVTFFAVGDPALFSVATGEARTSINQAAAQLLLHRRQGLAAIASTGVQVVDLSRASSSTMVMDTYLRMKNTGQL